MNYHVLALNILANGLENVVINNCAVGDANGEVSFCIAQDGAFSSLIDTGRKTVIQTTKIPMVTLDSYCSEHNLPRIDILKVDVEGAEPAVVRGAGILLADPERRPRLVMLELFEPMLRQFGCTIAEMAALMRTYKYDAFVFVEGRLVQFAESHYNRFYNVLFLSSDCDRLHALGGSR
jgi:FkbM family methyltransferase